MRLILKLKSFITRAFVFQIILLNTLKKTAETYVLGGLKDFEYKTCYYNDLMNQIPKEIPPELKIKINRSNIPNYSTVFMKSVAEYKEKLTTLVGTETKSSKTVTI